MSKKRNKQKIKDYISIYGINGTTEVLKSKFQIQFLQNLWQSLRCGGNLLYVTCSIFDEENDLVVEQFLNERADAIIEGIDLPLGKPTKFGWQVLPCDGPTDGFYYCQLRKV